MPSDRLSLALGTGAVSLPATGAIGVFSDDLPPVPEELTKDRLRFVSPWIFSVDSARADGIAAAASDAGPFAASIVRTARSRAANRLAFGLAMAATTPGGPVLVDGQKTDGVDALLREVRGRTRVPDSFVKHHGRLFWLPADKDAFSDWAQIAEDWPQAGGFYTAPGAFSADGPDPASVALAEALPEDLPARIADLGAGWGYLAAQILARSGAEQLDLVEAHHGALEAARRNITDARARFHWADATRWAPEAPVDAVIMNPPFHIGRAADPALGQAFLGTAARILDRQGVLWLVANRQLPYEAMLRELFADVETRPAPAGFKIIVARVPRSPASHKNKETVRDLFR